MVMFKFKAYSSGSHGNLYTLSDGKTSILIECGLPISDIKRYLEFDLSMISGCLCSHRHFDHSKSSREIMYHGIDLYCGYEMADTMDLSGHRLHILPPMVQFKIGTLTVLPFPLEHDVPIFGFLISSDTGGVFLFATDTYFIKPRFSGLTEIAIECNWSRHTIDPGLEPSRLRRLQESHMSLETLKVFLKANDLSNVKKIHLLHLSDENSNAEIFEKEIEKLTGIPTVVAPRRA